MTRARLSTTLRSPPRRTQSPAAGLVRADQSYPGIVPVRFPVPLGGSSPSGPSSWAPRPDYAHFRSSYAKRIDSHQSGSATYRLKGP